MRLEYGFRGGEKLQFVSKNLAWSADSGCFSLPSIAGKGEEGKGEGTREAKNWK
jgi:hypothetical protein